MEHDVTVQDEERTTKLEKEKDSVRTFFTSELSFTFVLGRTSTQVSFIID